jgi:hypothetical protein
VLLSGGGFWRRRSELDAITMMSRERERERERSRGEDECLKPSLEERVCLINSE